MMSDPTDAIDLIARTQKATGPDRELDLEILNYDGRQPPWIWLDRASGTITREQYGPGAAGNPVASLECFTGSVDAALTLIPDGYAWRLDQALSDAGDKTLAWASVEGFHANRVATPALALCAAALKARLP